MCPINENKELANISMYKWYESELKDGTKEIECTYCGKRYKKEEDPASQMVAHVQYCTDILETLPIYYVPDTGCGCWTDTEDESHSHKIDMYEASEILERIGIIIESTHFEEDNAYYMIPDDTQEDEVPGLYIPKIAYNYIIHFIKPELGDKREKWR